MSLGLSILPLHFCTMGPLLACEFFLIAVCLLSTSVTADGKTPSDQLTGDDVFKIVTLIRNPEVESASESAPVPTILTTLLEEANKNKSVTETPSPSIEPSLVQEQEKQELQKLILQEKLVEAQKALLAKLLADGGGGGVSPQRPIKQQDFSSFHVIEPAMDPSSNNQLNYAGGIPPQTPIKQQDFSSFQSTEPTLDQSSANNPLNQLGGVLNLLGTLGSLAGPATSLLSLGNGQSDFLSGLLGLGANRLKSQAPELMSNLGTFVSAVQGAIRGPSEGKPKLRGVDTRVGLGYRMGESADAQVVFEIGPQLFTEPMTDEQKQQLAIQQQQKKIIEYLQRQQQLQPNNRFQGIQKRHLQAAQATLQKQQSINAQMLRQHLAKLSELKKATPEKPSPQSTTLRQQLQLLQPPKKSTNLYQATKTPSISATKNLATGAPSNNYENTMAEAVNSIRNFINLPKKKDNNFTFSKAASNIVRVRVQPQKSFRSVAQKTGRKVLVPRKRIKVSPVRMQSRMDVAEDSDENESYDYDYKLVKVKKREKPRFVEIIRKIKTKPKTEKKESLVQTLGEWNENHSFFDLVQSYVVDRAIQGGNKIVKNMFKSS